MELERLGSGKAHCDKFADMLEQLPLFNGFSRADVEHLAVYMEAYRANKGAVLFKEGGKDETMWFLVQGKVDIVKEADGNKQCRITTITRGKSIGEMSVIDGMPYSATGITQQESILIQLTRENFDAVCRELPMLGVKILKRLAKLLSMRLRQTSGALVQMTEK